MTARAVDVACANRLADAARAAILPHFRRLDHIDIKADASPVTVADRGAERAMRALLAAECADDGILGEEFPPVAGRSGRTWVLDPIDGTKAFTAGKPWFTTLIGLVKGDVPVLGCIDQPVLGERWLGHDGTTTLNAALVTPRPGVPLARAVLSSTSPDMFVSADERAALARLKAHVAYTSWGGDAYAYALVASGHVDLVLEMGLKPFDFAALAPIIEGAGGLVTDWRGASLTMASDGHVLAARTAALHAEALSILNGT